MQGAAWLERYLEDDDHACYHEAREDCECERSASHPDQPGRETRPEGERDCFHPDHGSDGVHDGDSGEIEQEQEREWRNRQEQESRLGPRVREPLGSVSVAD
jgi:hypothetical protein